MGIIIAKNTINSMIKSSIDVTNKFTTICTSTNQQANDIINITDCTCDQCSIIQNSSAVVSNSCITNTYIKESIKNSVNQNIRQQAQAISASFGFPSVTDSEAFLAASLKIADTVTTTFNNTCTVDNTNSKTVFNCKDSKFQGLVVDQTSYVNVSQNCIFKAIVETDVANNAIQKLQSSTLAKQYDTFASLLFGFILLIAVFGWLTIRFAENPAVQVGVVVIILVSLISSIAYAYTARTSGRYPFKKA